MRRRPGGLELQLRRLTGLTDGAAVVGLEGGVDAVGGGAVGDAAVHLPVGLAAAALAPGHLRDAREGVNKYKWCEFEGFAFWRTGWAASSDGRHNGRRLL